MLENEVYDVREVDSGVIKCESCGSNMSFEPSLQKLKCRHCGAIKEIQSSISEEIDLMSDISKAYAWEDDKLSAFDCVNCGAQVVLQKTEIARVCPFCGTSHVKKTHEIKGLKPNGVLPFSINLDNAVEYSRLWAKKRFFAPRSFKKNLSAENVKGIYSPCFTFDTNTYSFYEGRIGIHKTRTVGSGKNRRTQTYTVWRNISGQHDSSFDDVLISSGKKVEQNTLNSIAPFDTNNGKNYKEEYLLGYLAYQNDEELSDCWGKAKNLLDSKIKAQILSKYHYDTVAYLNVWTKHEKVTYKYVMLPIYVGNFKFKKKLYNFFVNGSTGKVFGKYPKSVSKIVSLIVAIGLIVGAVVYLLS